MPTQNNNQEQISQTHHHNPMEFTLIMFEFDNKKAIILQTSGTEHRKPNTIIKSISLFAKYYKMISSSEADSPLHSIIS
jgi:hypothetical protein